MPGMATRVCRICTPHMVRHSDCLSIQALALGSEVQAITAGRFLPHDTSTDQDSSGLAFTDRDSTGLGFMEARDSIPALDFSALVLFRGLTASDHSAADTDNATPDGNPAQHAPNGKPCIRADNEPH